LPVPPVLPPPGIVPPVFTGGSLLYGITPNPTGAEIVIGNAIINQHNGVVFAKNYANGDIRVRGGRGILANGGRVILDSSRNISLKNTSSILTSSTGNAGDVKILANNDINLSPGSTIEAIGTRGGNITLQSFNGDLNLNDNLITSVTAGTQKGGDINFFGQSISLTNQAVAANLTLGTGQAGDINVQAKDSINIRNTNSTSIASLKTPGLGTNLASFVNNTPATGFISSTLGPGDRGNITMNAHKISVRNEIGATGSVGATTASQNSGSLVGNGNVGNLTINAIESIEIVGNRTGPFTPDITDGALVDEYIAISTGFAAPSNGRGSPGDVTVNTPQLKLRDGAAITTGSSFADGVQRGTVTVNATELIELEGFAALGTATQGTGDAGDLFVNVPNGKIRLLGGAGFVSDTFGSGNAGTVSVNAMDLEIYDGSRIGSSTVDRGAGGLTQINVPGSITLSGRSADGSIPSGLFVNSVKSGNAGSLEIATGQLNLFEGAEITAATTGTGQGGQVTVRADSVRVDGRASNGSASRITAFTRGTGNGGDLSISARHLAVTNGGEVSADASGSGRAGTLAVNASETVEVLGPSRIFFDSTGSGDVGELSISTQRLFVRNGGRVSASTLGSGRGGILEVSASEIVET